jgi:succinoglycan biosynthesis protein ExoM
MRVDVNLCTFRRPEGMQATLAALDAQNLPEGVAMRVLLIDNDTRPTAQEAARAAAARMRVPLVYIHAPAANIALARNAGLAASEADWVAFLDDDETVSPDWLARLLARQRETGADAVFGPSKAMYEADAPAWIVARDYHSNIPEVRGGVVETGYSCNALLRWQGAPWTDERFDLARGTSGGEDTEFFFRLHRMGAVFDIAWDAVARESVPPERLTYVWLARRRYRMGQSYASSAVTWTARARLLVSAAAKAGFCYAMAALNASSRDTRNFWRLRAALHRGVCAGCLDFAQPELYGS